MKPEELMEMLIKKFESIQVQSDPSYKTNLYLGRSPIE